MKQTAMLLPLLVLSACARTEAVTDDDLEEIEEVPSANIPLAEEADDGPDALPTNAMSWSAVGDAVQLGSDLSGPALEIACADNDQGIVLTRYGVEGDGSAGTLTVVGNGASARVPVVAAAGAQEGEFNWTATLARGELASNIRTSFQPDEPVNITATGVDPIVIAPAQNVRDLLDRCVGGTTDRPTSGQSDADVLREGVEEQNAQ
ncbi:hypothetical protein WJT74_09305 [Sphingomicrobium sp. XHP0239]|uniref:hypothetical protein n=1 Tax=Sphingomicrobium maritimum TaxID=3133972 RepID=UPI0031CC6EB7